MKTSSHPDPGRPFRSRSVNPLRTPTVAALLALSSSAAAQTWSVAAPPSVLLPTGSDASCTCPDPVPPPCNSAEPTVAIPGFQGNDLAWSSRSFCVLGNFSPCGCRGTGEALVRLDGVGTDEVTIRWDATAFVKHGCAQRSSHPCNCPSTYNTGASAAIDLSIDLGIAGLPAGTPVNVFYSAGQYSNNRYRPEANDDTSSISGGTTSVDGTALYSGDLDLVNVAGLRTETYDGSFGSAAGAVVNVDSSVTLDVRIIPPPRGTTSPCFEHDAESVAWGGVLVLSLTGPPAPPFPVVPPLPQVEFSVDLASASELSDFGPDANDRFDPGDLYLVGGPALPPGGADGVRDDAVFFGADPFPDPIDPAPPATAAPACSGMPPALVVPAFFDLDGTDALEFSLVGLIPPAAPLPAPLPRFASTGVHEARALLLSFDDDGPGPYHTVFCEPPTASFSPGDAIHGSAQVRDEVLGAVLVPGPLGAGAATYSIASERDVHRSLAPNPPPNSLVLLTPNDDDVDALDVNDGSCPVWLFSVDHEADMGLFLAGTDPGAIYEATGAGPVKVIDEAIHLGLPEDTDLDAFELVFLPDPAGLGGEVLGLLFSVCDDDPTTLGDESGGLDPAMLYASGFTGASFPFLAEPLEDDVDAIAAWPLPLLVLPGPRPIRPQGGVDGQVVGMPE